MIILSCRIVWVPSHSWQSAEANLTRYRLIPVGALHLHFLHFQIKSSDPTLQGSIATVVAELHIALSVVLLTTPLMKPFVAVYVDENGLAYTDDASKSRSRNSSRSRTFKTMMSLKGRDPYAWTEDRSAVHPERSVSDSRILKSVHITVDRNGIELPKRETPQSWLVNG